MNLISPEKNQESKDLKEKELIETGARVCINCSHWHRPSQEADDGDCRRLPPHPFVFPAKTPLGAPAMIVQCFFPKCRPKVFCGEFTPSSNIVAS